VCARFAIARGPGERINRSKSAESGQTYPGAILLGPWIIAEDSPVQNPQDFSKARVALRLAARYRFRVHRSMLLLTYISLAIWQTLGKTIRDWH
jgi:hypothetical protein